MRIKCDSCKKMITINSSIDEKYYSGRKIVGYTLMKGTGIIKIAGVGGKPRKTTKKTLHFYCKKCYDKKKWGK